MRVCVCLFLFSVSPPYCKYCLSSFKVKQKKYTEQQGLFNGRGPMKGGTDKFPVIVGDHRECSEGVGLLRRRHKSVSAAAPDLKNIPTNGRRSLTPFTRATDLRVSQIYVSPWKQISPTCT